MVVRPQKDGLRPLLVPLLFSTCSIWFTQVRVKHQSWLENKKLNISLFSPGFIISMIIYPHKNITQSLPSLQSLPDSLLLSSASWCELTSRLHWALHFKGTRGEAIHMGLQGRVHNKNNEFLLFLITTWEQNTQQIK